MTSFIIFLSMIYLSIMFVCWGVDFPDTTLAQAFWWPIILVKALFNGLCEVLFGD